MEAKKLQENTDGWMERHVRRASVTHVFTDHPMEKHYAPRPGNLKIGLKAIFCLEQADLGSSSTAMAAIFTAA